MLDTNIVSQLVRHPTCEILQRITNVGPDAVCVSIISAAELRYGAAKKASPKLLDRVNALLDSIEVLPLSAPTDEIYAALRTSLEAAGTPIGPNDLLIAAHALAVGAILVTDNTGEFSRVPSLRVENWLI
jgi:tRNA(fMet)-specific endonuclease VapC